jgi:hypothetical protein
MQKLLLPLSASNGVKDATTEMDFGAALRWKNLTKDLFHLLPGLQCVIEGGSENYGGDGGLGVDDESLMIVLLCGAAASTTAAVSATMQQQVATRALALHSTCAVFLQVLRERGWFFSSIAANVQAKAQKCWENSESFVPEEQHRWTSFLEVQQVSETACISHLFCRDCINAVLFFFYNMVSMFAPSASYIVGLRVLICHQSRYSTKLQ